MKNYAASLKVRLSPFHAAKYLPTLILLLIVIALPPTLYAQESPITVSLNNTHYTTDELIILTVSVVDDSPQQPRPILPPLDGLAVVDFDITTNVSAVQDKIFTEVVYTYELQPRRTGSLIIPPIPVKIDDKIFRSAPISIMVTQGTAPAPSPGNEVAPLDIVPPANLEGQDFFVEAVVDIAEPYIGQQLIYIFRFYQALQLYRQPQSEMPIFNGFETIGLPVQQYNLEIAGRIYLISEIRTALFPKSSGAIKIGPARLMFPGNFFEDAVELYAEPITVQVKPLPDNPPPGFDGAVGQYSIEAWFSPQVAVINQPSTYSVAISGSGNIYALPQPIWPPMHEWRTFDSLTSQTTDMKDGVMTGTRVFERLMISSQLGDLTIPPTLFVYFDPTASTYRTLSSTPLLVRVIPAPTPNPAAPTANVIIAASTATPAAAIDTIGTAVPPGNSLVNPLLPNAVNPNWRAALPFGLILILAVCGSMPLAAAMGAGGVWFWQKRQQKLLIKAETLKNPRQKMHPVLLACLSKSDDNYKIVAEALNSYLSELLKVPTKGLTRTELADRLQKRGLDRAYIRQISDYLAQSDTGRYAPRENGDAGWDLLVKTDVLLLKLDEIFAENSAQLR